MKLRLLWASLLTIPLALTTQTTTPEIVSTLQTTNTSPTSVSIGCAVGSSTCTGGISAGSATFGSGVTAATVAIGGGAALTNSSQIPLLNANNVFSATGSQTIGLGGTSTANDLLVINGPSGTTAGAYLEIQKNSVAKARIGSSSAILDGGTTDAFAINNLTATALELATNGTLRWGINSAGDFTEGASNHIADSVGTPTIGSGFGSGAAVTGTDYAFKINVGTTNSTGGTITFGHTWSSQAICTFSTNATPSTPNASFSTESSGTTTLTISQTNSSNFFYYVLCRSF